jgi:hypothetical protein
VSHRVVAEVELLDQPGAHQCASVMIVPAADEHGFAAARVVHLG